MRFVFQDKKLESLYTSGGSPKGYPPEVIKAFFRMMTVIRSASDERDLREMRSLNYERLKGNRSHQHSLRLNKQWRLIIEREVDDEGRYLLVIKIEDYH